MTWTQVSVVVDGEAAEAVAEALRPFAHGGVLLEQTAADIDRLNDEVTVSIYFPRGDDKPALRRRIEEILWHLGQLYPIPAPTFREVHEEDWASAWKQHYTPLRVGQRLLICPAWDTLEPRSGEIIMTIDPGMAFGTGLHPTTRMCLEVLEARVRPVTSVLDVGTGSGILSIAAALLGADPILALDTDEVAVKAARSNSAANRVASVVQVRHGALADLEQSRAWDIVLVNILASVILQLLGEGLAQHVRPGGLMVLSGIIEEQAAEMQVALARENVNLIERRQTKDWVTLVGRRQEGK